MKAVVYKTDGSKVFVEPQNKKEFTLEEMQSLVGGYVELIGHFFNYLVLGDEEGGLKNKPYNRTASLKFGFPLMGDIVFCPTELFK